jgi:hypothetical protein
MVAKKIKKEKRIKNCIMRRIRVMVQVARYGGEWAEAPEGNDYHVGAYETVAHIVACLMSDATDAATPTSDMVPIIFKDFDALEARKPEQIEKRLIEYYRENNQW